MRAFLFLVLVLQLMFEGITSGSNIDKLQEARLIRRAYIDVTGTVPTAEEIDWFVVYNEHGYELAIDHLFRKYDTKLIKEYLLSEGYKNQKMRSLSEQEVNRSLLYVVGMSNNIPITEIRVEQAKQLLIKQAILCSDDTDGAIDYICNAMMSRTSNVQENNKLSHKFRDALALSTEEMAWKVTMEEILKIPDVCNK